MIRYLPLVATGLLLGFSRLTAADVAVESEILSSYVQISSALAADNLAEAKTAAEALTEHAKKAERKELAVQAAAVAASDDLPVARNAFKALSATVAPLAEGKQGYTVMTCPMAGADWVQSSKDVRNPYYGKSMLTCGGPKAKK